MQPSQIAVLDQFQAIIKMRICFGREARDDICTEGDAGPQLARLFTEGNRIVAQMATLHPLQNQVVPVLKAQVKMRHQTRFRRDGQHQVLIRFNGINRADAQARQVRHQTQDAHDQIAQAWLSGQICAPAGQVHAGQHDLVKATIHKTFDLIDHNARRHRARISAP